MEKIMGCDNCKHMSEMGFYSYDGNRVRHDSQLICINPKLLKLYNITHLVTTEPMAQCAYFERFVDTNTL